MDDADIEYSESGSPIYKHKARERPFTVATGSEDIETLESHIEKYLGKIHMVWHELISDLVHIDVHHIKPTLKHNYHALVTTGMSDLPMSPPAEVSDCKYAELMITLPPGWLLSEKAFQQEKYYWVVRLIKTLARLPHEYQTWLWLGHTVPNGDPPRPYADSTKFVGAILAPPMRAPEGFESITCNAEKQVHFFSVIPLYEEEMNFKLKKGMGPLFDLFDTNDISDIVDVNRKNVAARKWWQLGH
jgi:hypothetical protein